ncbi:MAG: hypothetical protein F6K55_35680 [Moorea sp. SIO4A3]|nr:hypothetical protein [Moorena sp. SIO4A3]
MASPEGGEQEYPRGYLQIPESFGKMVVIAVARAGADMTKVSNLSKRKSNTLLVRILMVIKNHQGRTASDF